MAASTSSAGVSTQLRRYAKGVYWQDGQRHSEQSLPYRSIRDASEPLNAAEHAHLRNAMMALLRSAAQEAKLSALHLEMPKESHRQSAVIDFQSFLKQEDGKNSNFNSVGFVKLIESLRKRLGQQDVYVVARPSGVVRNDGYQARMKMMAVKVLSCEDGLKESLFAACVTLNLGDSAKLLTSGHLLDEKEALSHNDQLLLAAWSRHNVLSMDRKLSSAG